MLLYSMAKLTCNKIGKLRHLLVCIIPERKWAFICVTTETVFHICFLLSPLSIDTVSRLVYSDFIRIQFMSLCSCVRFQKSYCLGLASAEWQMLSIFGSSSTNQNNLQRFPITNYTCNELHTHTTTHEHQITPMTLTGLEFHQNPNFIYILYGCCGGDYLFCKLLPYWNYRYFRPNKSRTRIFYFGDF